MYFYVEYACIFEKFSKTIILLKKIIYVKITFVGSGKREKEGELKIPS